MYLIKKQSNLVPRFNWIIGRLSIILVKMRIVLSVSHTLPKTDINPFNILQPPKKLSTVIIQVCRWRT